MKLCLGKAKSLSVNYQKFHIPLSFWHNFGKIEEYKSMLVDVLVARSKQIKCLTN